MVAFTSSSILTSWRTMMTTIHGYYAIELSCKATSRNSAGYWIISRAIFEWMLLGGYLQWWFPSRCRHRFRTILIVPSTPNICMKATTQSIDAAGESILLRYAMMIFFDGGHIAGIATVAQTFHARPPDTEILLLKLRRTIIWFSSSWSSSRIPHGWFYVDNAAAENENGNVGHSRSGSNVTITQQSPRVLQKSTSVNSAYRWWFGVIDYLWLYARYSRYWGCLSTYDEMDRDVAFHHHTPPFT